MSVRTSRALFATLLLIALGPTAAEGHVTHTVQPGESLWSIAARDGLSVDELAAANGLPPDAWLLAGSTLLIPSTVHPIPTDETVTPEQVGSIASSYGMSAPLVQSLAWNESAFDNAAVSSAGARGVMQLMPTTWDFIQQQLAERPLDPASALDNVKAGVLYLHYLYHLKGGDGQATLASYFQGPNRSRLLPETRDYLGEVRADEADFGGGG